MHILSDYILLGVGLIFNFYIPGSVFASFFLKNIKNIYKLPLTLLLSVLLSTNFIYLLSLIFGYSDITILTTYVIWTMLYIFTNKKVSLEKKHYFAIGMSILVFFIFVISLFPAIWCGRRGYCPIPAVFGQYGHQEEAQPAFGTGLALPRWGEGHNEGLFGTAGVCVDTEVNFNTIQYNSRSFTEACTEFHGEN
jgi:hypothetical protein